MKFGNHKKICYICEKSIVVIMNITLKPYLLTTALYFCGSINMLATTLKKIPPRSIDTLTTVAPNLKELEEEMEKIKTTIEQLRAATNAKLEQVTAKTNGEHKEVRTIIEPKTIEIIKTSEVEESEATIVGDNLKNSEKYASAYNSADEQIQNISKKPRGHRSLAFLMKCLITTGLCIYFAGSSTGVVLKNPMIDSCNNSDLCSLMKNNAYSFSKFFGKKGYDKIFSSAADSDVNKNEATYYEKKYGVYLSEIEDYLTYPEIINNRNLKEFRTNEDYRERINKLSFTLSQFKNKVELMKIALSGAIENRESLSELYTKCLNIKIAIDRMFIK